MDSKKIANNMLEFLVNPRVFPVERRLYFRPEELLDNSWYENAVIDSDMAYGDQSKNSDFYPLRNRSTKREAGIMDRKTIIASLDVLSQAFKEDNPMAKDLRTMAYAVSQMSDEELESKLDVEASAWTDFIKKFKKEHPDMSMKEVLQEAGKAYKKEKKAEEETMEATENEFVDNWTKEADDAVLNAIVSDVLGDKIAGDRNGPGNPDKDGKGPFGGTPACPMSKKEKKEKDAACEKPRAQEEAPEEAPEKAPEEASKKKAEENVPKKKEKVPEEGKEAKNPDEVVDTDMLATINYDGVEFNDTMTAMDEIDLSQEEQDRLGQLFK